MSNQDKLKFLRAVETLSGAVRTQANGMMDDYFPKTVLAKKVETFILEEEREQLTSNVRQQAMLCIVTLRFLSAVASEPRGSLTLRTLGLGGRGKVWGLDFWGCGWQGPVIAASWTSIGVVRCSPISLLEAY